MNKRERILAAAVVGLVALFGLRYLYGRYERAGDVRQSQLGAAEQELADVKHSLNMGERSVRRMSEWQKQSLPPNREIAESMYRNWLLAKAKDAGLKVDNIKLARSTPSSAFTTVAYQVTASGTLTNVISMMYEFYRAPILHQITRLQLLRPVGATQLQVILEAEALSLPGAVATDSLPEGDSKRLRLASVADYQKSLGERDLASVYRPPTPPREAIAAPPPPPKFDEAEQAYFTSTVGPVDKLQAWINVRTTGDTLKLFPGEQLKVGALNGEIVSVERWSLVWQADGKKYRVPIGQSLRKSKEIAGDSSAAAKPEAESPDS